MRCGIGRVLIALLGALMLAVLAAGAQAEMKPINPSAAEGAAPPSAFAAPSTAQQSPGAFGGIFGWVAAHAAKPATRAVPWASRSLKGEHALAGAVDARPVELHLWRGACRGAGTR